MLRLSVLKGPDKGKTQTFHSNRVTIGDDTRNDFKLTDAMVSRFHSVIEITGEAAFVYRDLGSLNGSYVRSGEQRHSLHNRSRPQSVEVKTEAEIALGRTLLQVALNPSAETSVSDASSVEVLLRSSDSHEKIDNSIRESVVRRVNDTPEHLASKISTSSSRIQVLFKLARNLNGLNRIEDILDRVVEATFEIFPLANFFAIVVPSGHESNVNELVPLYTQHRVGSGPKELILSQSILREVVEKRESVLYVHDNLAQMDTRKSIVMAQITACLAAPLFGQKKLMGVMQVDSRGRTGMFGYDDLDLFTVLASSAAFAMERAELSRNIYEMFEAFVNASVAAIDARDPTTAGHSERVADYTVFLANEVNIIHSGSLAPLLFNAEELVELRYAALLHDFGKIGVREEVLQKASRLHPGVCNTLLQTIETARAIKNQVILRHAHQRWVQDAKVPTRSDIEAIDRAIVELNSRMDAYRDLVLRLQKPFPLDKGDLAILERMANERYIDSAGVERALLSETDRLDLSIERGTLNEMERNHINAHAALSFDYLSKIPWSPDLAQIPCIAGRHHEKLDGSGYPKGFFADKIPHQVRILTIADIFDALTATDRPYKRARSVDDAVGLLRREADEGKLDGDLVELFAEQVCPRLTRFNR